MNWKDEAISKLKLYNAKKAAFISLGEEIERVRSKVESVSATDYGKPSVMSSCAGDGMLSSIAMIDELERNRDLVCIWLRGVERGLACLNDVERIVLDELYLRPCGGVESLMERLHVEKTKAYTLKDKAVRQFTLAMYGLCES